MSKTETKRHELRDPTEAETRALLKRISSCRTRLLALVPFFGHLALNLRPRVSMAKDGVPTAAVTPDGSLILNVDFCADLNDAQLCGLLCHEVLHPALLAWQRQGGRKIIVTDDAGRPASLWNIAHDMSFNPEIEELAERSEAKGQICLPPDPCMDKKYKGHAAEEIYDALLQQAKKGGNGGGGGGGGTMHVPGLNGIGDDLREDLCDSQDGQKAAKGDPGAQKRLENDWKVNVVAAAQVQEREKGKGTLPGGIQKMVDELTDPVIDWKDELSRWIGENGRRQDYTYRRPARRSESVGEYLPSLQKFGVADIVILWDTSGSMNGRETEILSEVQGIVEDLGISVRVICIDTQIHSDVTGIDDALEVIPHIKGGGGSDFHPAFERLDDEQYDGVVVSFTDGYIDVPATKPHNIKAVLWVIGAHDTDPTGGKWGEVLNMNDEAVRRK
jgi:predicted metal-dependent peptidase